MAKVGNTFKFFASVDLVNVPEYASTYPTNAVPIYIGADDAHGKVINLIYIH